MLYLYALLNAPLSALKAEPSWSGWHGVPLQGYTHESHTAVVCPLSAPMPPTHENLWAHEQLVEQLMTHVSALLPVRFGTILADDTAVVEMLAQNKARFQSAFSRVSGKVELSVRILWKPPAVTLPPLDKTSGSAYLRSKLAIEQAFRTREEQGRAFCTAVQTPLYSLSTAHTEQITPDQPTLLKAAYLVEKANVPAFQAAITQLNQAHPLLQILCTGPWPPYHFV